MHVGGDEFGDSVAIMVVEDLWDSARGEDGGPGRGVRGCSSGSEALGRIGGVWKAGLTAWESARPGGGGWGWPGGGPALWL